MISSDTNPTAPANLARVLRRQKKGQPHAVYAACTANAYAIRAVLAQAAKDGSDVLVESTTSQVNIAGGYSGLTPSDFRRRVFCLAAETGLAPDRVVLGGDHVGPYMWRHEGGRRAIGIIAMLISVAVFWGAIFTVPIKIEADNQDEQAESKSEKEQPQTDKKKTAAAKTESQKDVEKKQPTPAPEEDGKSKPQTTPENGDPPTTPEPAKAEKADTTDM